MSTGTDFGSSIAYGCLLSISRAVPGQGSTYTVQNFFDGTPTTTITRNNATYGYAPFGWKGATVNRSGDNQATSIILPNNSLSQTIVTNLFSSTDFWYAVVETALLNPDNSADFRVLTAYVGQLINAVVSGSTIEIEVGSILDAVGADIPRRRITEDIFGPIPTTANVRLQ